MDFESLEEEEISRGVEYESFSVELQRAKEEELQRAKEEELRRGEKKQPQELATKEREETKRTLPRDQNEGIGVVRQLAALAFHPLLRYPPVTAPKPQLQADLRLSKAISGKAISGSAGDNSVGSMPAIPSFPALPRPSSDPQLQEVAAGSEDSPSSHAQMPASRIRPDEMGMLPSGFIVKGAQRWSDKVKRSQEGSADLQASPRLSAVDADAAIESEVGQAMQRYTKTELRKALFLTSILGQMPTLQQETNDDASNVAAGQRRLAMPDAEQLKRVLRPEEANKVLQIDLRLAISGEYLPSIRMRMWDTVAALRCAIARIAGHGGAVQIVWRDEVLQKGHASLEEVGISDDAEVQVLRAPFRFALTVCDSGAAKLWCAESGACLHTLEHTGTVRTAACSPDGSHVLTASVVANIWNSETGQPVSRLAGHTSLIRSAAFSSDGLRVITTSDDETARIWRTLKGICLQKLAAGPGQVIVAQFSQDGAMALTASMDGSVKCWEPPAADCKHTFRGNKHAAGSATFSPDGSAVMVSAGNHVEIWSSRTGQLKQTLKGHRRNVLYSAFSSDGASVVTASLDGTARLWELKLEEFPPMQSIKCTTKLEHDSVVRAATFSPDNSLVLTTCLDGAAQLWSSSTGEVMRVLSGHTGPVLSADFSTDSSLVITASDDASAKIWNAETGECMRTLQGHAAAVSYAYLLPA